MGLGQMADATDFGFEIASKSTRFLEPFTKNDYGETSFSYSPTSVGGCFFHLYPAVAWAKPKS
jgi:hypothetical protein